MKDIIKEFQSFKQNIYPKAYPIFNRLKLDDELSIENVYLIGTSYYDAPIWSDSFFRKVVDKKEENYRKFLG